MRKTIFTYNGTIRTNRNQIEPRGHKGTKATSFSWRLGVLVVKNFWVLCKNCVFKRITWLLVFMFAVSASTHAGEIVPYALAQRTQKAEVIAVAEVVSISSAWNDQGSLIFTYIELRVLEKIKGNFQDDKIVLKHVGGVVGNVESRVSGMPQFERNEKVLVFLGRYPNAHYFAVMDWLEGKKSIQHDLAGQETVRVGTRGERSQSLKEYISEIRSILKQK